MCTEVQLMHHLQEICLKEQLVTATIEPDPHCVVLSACFSSSSHPLSDYGDD